LVEARRADQRVTVRATGIGEEHGELEVLLDDVIGEADFFKSTEVNRQDVRREKDAALVAGGTIARTQAMVRQAAAIVMESDNNGDGGGMEPGSEDAGPELQQVGKARREEREARLQRFEERQAEMEELRTSAQKAQTEFMLSMLEIVQKKLP
jgi:hypothetical protein